MSLCFCFYLVLRIFSFSFILSLHYLVFSFPIHLHLPLYPFPIPKHYHLPLIAHYHDADNNSKNVTTITTTLIISPSYQLSVILITLQETTYADNDDDNDSASATIFFPFDLYQILIMLIQPQAGKDTQPVSRHAHVFRSRPIEQLYMQIDFIHVACMQSSTPHQHANCKLHELKGVLETMFVYTNSPVWRFSTGEEGFYASRFIIWYMISLLVYVYFS